MAVTLSAAVMSSHAYADEAISQKAVLITGASSGIGRNAAERLAAAGYFVYAGARKAADISTYLQSTRTVSVIRGGV